MITISIGSAVGEGTKARPAPNKPEDVRKVQQLLLKAMGNAPSMMKPGIADQATKSAISEFQSAWPGVSADATVDPSPGKTLQRLNRMKEPLVLEPISLTTIHSGGYRIRYHTADNGSLPKGKYRVLFGIENEHQTLDVTDCDSRDLLTWNNLPAFLQLIDQNHLWARRCSGRLYVMFDNRLVSQSNVALFQTPVAPYVGNLGRALLVKSNVSDFTYGANDAHGRDGRYLMPTPINGQYHFAYGDAFQTDPKMRGLVCITYVGAVYGISPTQTVKNTWQLKDADGNVPSSLNVMSAYGSQLATFLKAEQIDMEGRHREEIMKFFASHRAGAYMMWSSFHTVLVVDGVVHEFNKYEGVDGYHECDAKDYGYGSATWWIRKLSDPP